MNWLRKIIANLKWQWEEYKTEMYYAGAKDSVPYFIWEMFWFLVIRRAWTWLSGKTVCRLFGHNWVNEGWAGPDSGGDGGFCRRCGWSFHVTLY